MSYPLVPLGEVLAPVERPERPGAGTVYRQMGVRLWGEGAYQREALDGAQTKYATLSRVATDDIVVNKIWARNGSVAVVPPELAGSFVSGEFPTFVADRTRLAPRWFHWLTKTRRFWEQCDEKSRGTSGKNRIRPERFLEIPIPLPDRSEQQRVLKRIDELAGKIQEARRLRVAAMEETVSLYSSMVEECLRRLGNAKWAPIRALAEVRGGIQRSPERAPGANPVRYLTVAHVHRNHISLGDPRFFEVAPQDLDRWRLVPGDVLIVEGNGSADQIGRTALFRGEIDVCVHQNHLIRVRPHRAEIESEFLNLYLNSPAGQRQVQERSRTTSGLRILSVGRINQIDVPLPPLQEQRRLVAWVDELQGRVSALQREQEKVTAELEAMLPAVLERAFRGEL